MNLMPILNMIFLFNRGVVGFENALLFPRGPISTTATEGEVV